MRRIIYAERGKEEKSLQKRKEKLLESHLTPV